MVVSANNTQAPYTRITMPWHRFMTYEAKTRCAEVSEVSLGDSTFTTTTWVVAWKVLNGQFDHFSAVETPWVCPES